MLQSKTWIALVVLLIAGVAAYWQTTREDPRSASEERSSTVPSIDPEAIDEIAIEDRSKAKDRGDEPDEKSDQSTETPHNKIRLQKRDGVWHIVEPLEDRADGSNVSRALETLAKARFARRPTATSDKQWEKLKVKADEVLTVALQQKGKSVATLHIGTTGYVRVGEDKAVYQVHGLQRHQLAREVKMWRDREVSAFVPDQVKTLTVTTASGATATAERVPPAAQTPESKDPGKPPAPKPQATWKVVAGADLVGTFDPSTTRTMAQRLHSLKADDFADEVDKAGAGLTAPEMTISVKTLDDQEHVLLVGKTDGDHTFVGRPDSERVWKIRTNNLTGFAKAPLQWRDKTIAKIDPKEVAQVEVKNAGGTLVLARDGDSWAARKPKGLALDQSLAEQLAGTVRSLSGNLIVEGVSAKDAGLRKPEATAVFTTKAGQKTTLRVGAKHDRGRYLQSSARPEIMLVSDYQVRNLIKAPSEYEKKSES